MLKRSHQMMVPLLISIMIKLLRQADSMTDGTGVDVFTIDTDFEPSNVDTIPGFNDGEDIIR